jgi:ankyrin repeat protein
VNAQNNYNSTPLHLASEAGHVGVVRILLECGADQNMQDLVGRTPLQRTSPEGPRDIVQLLLHHGSAHGDSKPDMLYEATSRTSRNKIDRPRWSTPEVKLWHVPIYFLPFPTSSRSSTSIPPLLSHGLTCLPSDLSLLNDIAHN